MLLEYTSMTANLTPYNVLICLFHRLVSCLEDQRDYIWLFFFFFPAIGGVTCNACQVTSVESDSLRPRGACQAPLSTEFSRQGYWSGLPLPSSGDLPNPGIKCTSPVLAGGIFFTAEPAGWGARLGSFPEEAIGITQLYSTHSYPI